MASPQSSPPSRATDNTQPSTTESQTTSPAEAGVAQQPPTPCSSSEPLKDTDPPHRPEYVQRPIITYTRRQLLHLQSSPLVQPPEGMPLLKDWFGDWSEQHTTSQVKKDGGDPNGTTGTRRFPRRDHEEGDNAGRSAFRSTLSQPSQMGNFKHQSLRGDLTRADRERERERDRDRDNERDKEGHERLRSLSDMYDRDRMGLPLALPTSMRSQQRDSASHLSAASIIASAKLGAREGRDRSDRDKDRDRDRDRDKDGGRRGENRESGRRKGGESGDWRRGEVSRGGKDEHARREQERDGGERERSPEVERSRRDQSVSRERWTERTRDRDEGRDSRREPKGRDRDRDKDRDRDRDYHGSGSGSRAWRDKVDEHSSRLREEDERDSKDKDVEKGRDRPREDDRRSRLRDLESHSERNPRDRWSERVRDADRGEERRKGRDDGEKETKEERRERDRERRDRDRERAREHPDAKRDRELREGWTIAEEREARQQLAASGSSRRGAGRGGERRQAPGAGPDEERETRRERDKEPAWMDDYVPEPGSNKTGIFGGKIEGMDDEIQAWKKKQTSGKATASNTVEPSSESGAARDGVEGAARAKVSLDSASNDEHAKATEAFFFGLMRSESSKAKIEVTSPSKSPIAIVSPKPTAEPPPPDPIISTKHSPAPGLSLSTAIKSDTAAIPLSALGISPISEATKESPIILSPTGVQSTQNTKSTNPRRSPAPPSTATIPPSLSPAQGQLGSVALMDQPPGKPPNSQPFNPPQQSRVLALSAQSQQQQGTSESQVRTLIGQGPSARPGVIGPQPSPQPNRVQPSPRASETSSRVVSLTEQATQRIQAAESMHHRSMFSPFESGSQTEGGARQSLDAGYGGAGVRQGIVTSPVDTRSGFGAGDAMLGDSRNARTSPQTILSGSSYEGTQNASPNAASASASTYASGRGSRFAKFWDGKTKEAAAAGFMQAQAAAGIMAQGQQPSTQPPPQPPQSASPSTASQGQRGSDPNGFLGGNTTTEQNIQDMLTMLQNSTQGTRMNTQVNAMGGTGSHGMHRQPHASHLQALHEQQQIPHHQPQPQHHFSNASSLLENHQFENRPFVPDGMVPGLRPARSREGSSMPGGALSAPLYSETMDDSPFTVQQRMPVQQPSFEALAGRGNMPALYNNQGPGGRGMFQAPFRAEPSPLGGHNPLMGVQQQQQQRLPPGLANLGGRPPHDPNGYLGAMGMHGPHQQTFNAYGGSGGFGGGPLGQQQRGPLPPSAGPPPPPPPPPPMQTLLNNAHNALAASGHPDFTVQHHPGVRGPPPGQQLGGAGMRGGFGVQGGVGQHMQAPHGMRQQQHLVPPMLAPHLHQQQQQQHQQQQQQQQGGLLHGMHGGGQSQNEHLLSMLMGGIGPRE